MRLSDLQSKKIVEVTGGSDVGSIIDVNIRSDGVIESLVVDHGKRLFSLTRDNDMVLSWSHIEKIGEDFILVRKE